MSGDNGQLAPRREILAWALFDFANSSYTTVVTTAIFNAYFVKTIAERLPASEATLCLTAALGIANFLVVVTAPLIGAVADRTAGKKKFLLAASAVCVICTVLFATIAPGEVLKAMLLLVTANFAFGTCENLIAAFLPDLAPREKLGKISAFGWTLGYLGGLFALGLCLAYVSLAQKAGQRAEQFVPVTMLIVATIFTIAAAPSFFWLKERVPAAAVSSSELGEAIRRAFVQVRDTFLEAHRFGDLFTFLASLFAFSCGTTTVVALAAVYAAQVMGFSTADTIGMVMAVNVSAAGGAFLFGFIQERLGSVKSMACALALWIVAVSIAFLAREKAVFWLSAVLMGMAMGASASAGRALVGLLAPSDRSAEFFGLWGLTVKLAAVVGPLTYGLCMLVTGSNYRLALLSTIAFFVCGLVIVLRVDERRGRSAAEKI